MSGKTKFVLVYLSLLVASHVYVAWNDTDAAAGSLSSEAEWVLFAGAAGPDAALLALAGELENRGLSYAFADAEADLSGLSLGTQRVSLVGEGYGAVDALYWENQYAAAVERLVLIDPVVSPRFELLGEAGLNTAMKGLSLAWFWVLDHAVPHFGLAERLPMDRERAQRVFDADVARAEGHFENVASPCWIVLSEEGALAKGGAVAAFHSVNPQATVQSITDGDTAWLATVFEEGDVADAKAGRSFASLPVLQLDAGWAAALLAVATFASEDFACIGAGLLAKAGSISLWVAVLACLVGIFVGDYAIYFLGRIFGATALELPLLRRLASPAALERSSRWFERRGIALVILTRFLPGSRVPTYFAAGVVGVGWIRFGIALWVAALVWTPVLVVASYYLGDVFLSWFEGLGFGAWLGILLFVVGFSLCVRILVTLLSWRGRRLLYSRWRRLRAFEFWPMWAVYAPVVVYILWLCLRYRSISLPFSVNPCMPASGLVYESKIDILRQLERAGAPVARFEALRLQDSVGKRLEQLEGFMKAQGLGYPIVLKPDVGQRGQGVEIVRDAAQAVLFFEKQSEDAIAQEFIPGAEYGVFYQRAVDEPQGRVTSITDKRTYSIVGDGESTLETLILRDERAVCMAGFFLKEYEAQLDTVLAAGARFTLAAIGTHSRGAIFLDGNALATPALVAAIDAFSASVPGFHFGRYDLRVPDEEALRRGEGIKILELNGMTSEPTHMYDPDHGALQGWRTLARQWKQLYAIAARNRAAGHGKVSKRYVLKLVIGHLRGVPSADLF